MLIQVVLDFIDNNLFLFEILAKNQVRCSYCHEHALKVKMEKESNSQLAGPSTLTFDSVDTKRKHKRQIR